MSTTAPPRLKFNVLISQHPHKQLLLRSASSIIFKSSRRRRRTRNPLASSSFCSFNPELCSLRPVLTRVSSSDEGSRTFSDSPQQISTNLSETDVSKSSSPISANAHVALFIRMLGLDNDPLDREQAVDALWKYSLGGKQCIDTIMKSRGSVFLTVNLLRSESSAACEAAAGLLRTISSVNTYRHLVAESGAIQEITSLLRRSSLTSNVKEQSLCMLSNLSVDEKLRLQIANFDLLPLIIKFLDDEDITVKEAAGGVLANLALSAANHKIMVEAGVIPQLAKFLIHAEGSKSKISARDATTMLSEPSIIRKEAKNVLLELAKDDYYKILVMEEGLVLVPLVGAAAYKSFKPAWHSWPSLPDGTEIDVKRRSEPSRYDASDVLLGLHVKDIELDESKRIAMHAQIRQQFFARMGLIEQEHSDKDKPDSGSPSSNLRYTILPWMDGVARMVLILQLEDEVAIAKAAESIADASITEHMRVSLKEAGVVKNLIRLMDHQSESVRLAVIRALEKLSISNDVCQNIQAEGALNPLIRSLGNSNFCGNSTHLILNILARILDPSKEMKSKFYDGPVDESKKELNVESSSKMTFSLI